MINLATNLNVHSWGRFVWIFGPLSRRRSGKVVGVSAGLFRENSDQRGSVDRTEQLNSRTEQQLKHSECFNGARISYRSYQLVASAIISLM